METVFILSQAYNMTPFYFFDREVDEVIAVINHHIERGRSVSKNQTVKKSDGNKPERIKVNDKTATGGWF